MPRAFPRQTARDLFTSSASRGDSGGPAGSVAGRRGDTAEWLAVLSLYELPDLARWFLAMPQLHRNPVRLPASGVSLQVRLVLLSMSLTVDIPLCFVEHYGGVASFLSLYAEWTTIGAGLGVATVLIGHLWGRTCLSGAKQSTWASTEKS